MSGLDVTMAWEPDGLCRIGLRGEARLDTLPRLDEVATELERRDAKRILADLTFLTFMDSASTGSLLRMHQRTCERGGSLVLYGLPRLITRLFESLGFDETFCIEPDEDAARSRLL